MADTVLLLTTSTNETMKKKWRYIEGLRRFKTIQEAMIFAGVNYRSNLTYWRQTDETFAGAEKETTESIDIEMEELAEKQLYLQIQLGEAWAIRYYLDRRSAKYKPKAEIGTTDMDAIEKQRSELKQLLGYVQTNIAKSGPNHIESDKARIVEVSN